MNESSTLYRTGFAFDGNFFSISVSIISHLGSRTLQCPHHSAYIKPNTSFGFVLVDLRDLPPSGIFGYLLKWFFS
jgi:hypothetical protein